ncbi:MAG: hypothetical protein II942_04205 [Alphaproteobacteria bacterium]|nr:hypothetical protein [Alphaproteobacteria bacterium]
MKWGKFAILITGVLIGVGAYYGWQKRIQTCDFYRNGKCFSCQDVNEIPVGYKENCTFCANRQAAYVSEGLVPAWQCLVKVENEEEQEVPDVRVGKADCPEVRPLKDIVGNCYVCGTPEPVRLSDLDKMAPCVTQRYAVPDGVTFKTMKCPDLSDITDAEMCLMCGGFVDEGGCARFGKNDFCETNADCGDGKWCYPLRLIPNGAGVCAREKTSAWLCSVSDGYDLKQAQLFCERQNAHIPTLEEIGNAEEDLRSVCPTIDIWTFFQPDGVVWLQSFTQEFLFTREGESEVLGGHTFHALCHKD